MKRPFLNLEFEIPDCRLDEKELLLVLRSRSGGIGAISGLDPCPVILHVFLLAAMAPPGIEVISA